jgi:hypothetical protein
MGIYSQKVPRSYRIWVRYFIVVKGYCIGLLYTESQKYLLTPQFRKTEPVAMRNLYIIIEDFFLNRAVSVLLIFASLPDCSQNQTAVSDTLRLLSDF